MTAGRGRPLSGLPDLKVQWSKLGGPSAINDATFYVIRNFTGLLITEIMYHPAARADGRHLEFVELYNSKDRKSTRLNSSHT